MRRLKRRALILLVVFSMILCGMTACSNSDLSAEVSAKDTVDGNSIEATTAVDSLEALVNAEKNQYFEVGGLRIAKLQEGIYHIDEGTTEHPDGPQEDGSMNGGASMYLVIGDETAALIEKEEIFSSRIPIWQKLSMVWSEIVK